MTAKRKTTQRKDDDAAREQSVMDGLLETIMETEEGAAWVNAFIEGANNPVIKKRRKRSGARQEAFHTFLQYLVELPAGHTLPKGFQSKWLKWLRRFERDEITRLPPKDRAADRVSKWVKLAWFTTAPNNTDELQTGRFIYHDQRPSADKHPIPIILIHVKGQWRMSAQQRLAAIQHPFTRAFCDLLAPFPDKASILTKICWATKLEANADSPEFQLAEAAHHLQAAFGSDILECLPTPMEGFIAFDQLPDNSPFWHLLDAAIGFGRMLQHQETFGDGTVEAALRRGIRSEIGLTYRQAVAGLMDDYFNENGSEATSAQLLSWLGATRPASDSEPIHFPERRGSALRGIRWPDFDQTVKNEKRSR
jgi:hypothetical protein